MVIGQDQKGTEAWGTPDATPVGEGKRDHGRHRIRDGSVHYGKAIAYNVHVIVFEHLDVRGRSVAAENAAASLESSRSAGGS